MATSEAKPKKIKAPKAPKDQASVGPITGEIEATPGAPAPAPEKKAKKDSTALVAALEQQYVSYKKILTDSNAGKKQPRQLRWALKALDAAHDAALRHVRHNG